MKKMIYLGLFLLTTINVAGQLEAATHLRCSSPFVKVQTFNNAIKCKKVQSFTSAYEANSRAKHWRRIASCNAHTGAPKSKVWRKQLRPGVFTWKARVTFICALIN